MSQSAPRFPLSTIISSPALHIALGPYLQAMFFSSTSQMCHPLAIHQMSSDFPPFPHPVCPTHPHTCFHFSSAQQSSHLIPSLATHLKYQFTSFVPVKLLSQLVLAPRLVLELLNPVVLEIITYLFTFCKQVGLHCNLFLVESVCAAFSGFILSCLTML